MFEKYTEAARKVIFFARYEASQLGGEAIDTEHLLLGVFRSDPPLAQRVLKNPGLVRSIREQIEKTFSRDEKSETSVDLALTAVSRNVLKRAAKEAELANHPNIYPEHLFLALILVEDCNAAKILIANGVTPAQLKQQTSNLLAPEAGPVLVPRPKSSDTQRDLTTDARDGKLSPLIGRERELGSIVRILSRRDRSNPVLIGEPGVGKDALVGGLAQKIADGDVPAGLDGRRVLAIEGSVPPAVATEGNAIIYIHGLFDLPAGSEIWNTLAAQLLRGGFQCIATGTASGYRMTMERAGELARHFEVVAVQPPDEAETARIAKGVKPQYEQFHGVTIADEAVDAAISASRWFLRHRELPDRVIDLLDEAAANVKLKREWESEPIAEINKRRRALIRQMEEAITNHEFEKARFYSMEERKEREKVDLLREEPKQSPPDRIVSLRDIVETVAARANVTPEAVTRAMNIKNASLTAAELASKIPSGGRQLAEALVTYLAGCSPEEAEQLCNAIRAAKVTLDQL